jgi:hypothetical protein
MNMAHLTKCQIIMVNLTKGQIKMVNLTKPYSFNMANFIKPCPFRWTFVHIDEIFSLTLDKKGHSSQTY